MTAPNETAAEHVRNALMILSGITVDETAGGRLLNGSRTDAKLARAAAMRLQMALDVLEPSPGEPLEIADHDAAGEHDFPAPVCRYPGERSECTFPACACGMRDGWRL